MNLRTSLIASATVATALAASLSPLAASAQTNAPMRPVFQERLAATTTTSVQVRNRQVYEGGARLASTTSIREQARVRATTTPRGAEVRAEVQNRILARAEERATQEIDRRIAALEAFSTRIGNVRLSASEKSTLQSTMLAQIADLNTLKSQIASTTSTTTMRNAVQSITKSYRIFALVIPQSAVLAAADRVNNLVSQMQQLSTKLSARLSGNTDATLASALSDFNAKVADAASQAQAAISEVQALAPDNGSTTQLQANQKALQDARKKLQAAEQDLKDARKDAGTIIRAVSLGAVTATTTASTSATASSTAQ